MKVQVLIPSDWGFGSGFRDYGFLLRSLKKGEHGLPLKDLKDVKASEEEDSTAPHKRSEP